MSTGDLVVGGARVLGGSAALVAGAAGPYLATEYSMAITVWIAASAGTIGSFAFAGKLDSRMRMFQVAFACMTLGWAMTTLIELYVTHKYGWTPVPRALGAIALITSFFSRWIVPAVIERIGPWLDNIPFLNRKGK